MEGFFRSGLVADLILLVLALEFAALALHRARTGRGVAPGALLPFLLAGAGFALALRAALTGQGWAWVAAPLGAAFLAHLWDLARRWERAPPPPRGGGVSSRSLGADRRSRR